MEANSNQGKPVIKVTIFIEVAQGDIFMEQKMRFGLVLGWLAILKKRQIDIKNHRLFGTYSCQYYARKGNR
jgi:hypothetical protein